MRRRFYHGNIKEFGFISTWDTRNLSAGSSASNQISLPLSNNTTTNILVDWGDGTTNEITAGLSDVNRTHTYSTAGVYTIKINKIDPLAGLNSAWNFNNGKDKLKILSISDWGDLDWNNQGDNKFYGCLNMTVSTLTGLTVTNFQAGFSDTAITALKGFDTSAVTSFNFSFRRCYNLVDFDLDLSSMSAGSSMFQGVTLPTALWSNLIIATEANNINSNVTWSGGLSKYNASAQAARDNLVARGWTITDGGLAP